MHHKDTNNKHSSDNHDSAQHKKSNYPEGKLPSHAVEQRSNSNYPSGRLPTSHVKQREGGSSFLQKIKNKIKEPPATKEEIGQLRLDTIREELKTRKQKAKNGRPSRFDGIGGGSFGGGGGRTGHRSSGGGGMFGGGDSSGSWLMGGGDSGPSLDFITGNNSRPSGRGRRSNNDDGGISGKGLSDLFT